MHELSLAVVGINHPNSDGRNRRFELAICTPGEPVQLVLDPKNKFDSLAVAVVSARGIQIGYLTAERCGWIGARIRAGEHYEVLFQEGGSKAAWIRIRFGGGAPTIPPARMPATLSGDGWQPDPEGPDWGA